jgi:hypothetical protein
MSLRYLDSTRLYNKQHSCHRPIIHIPPPFPSPSSQPASQQSSRPVPPPRGTYCIHRSPTCLARAWSFSNPIQRPTSLPSCQSYAPTLAPPPLYYCTHCCPAKPSQIRYSLPGLPTRCDSRLSIPAAFPSLSLLNLDDCAFALASQ